MILLNVFLRPAMMVIGFISAIAMSYVAVWVVNAGFQNAVGFMTQGSSLELTGATSLMKVSGVSIPGIGSFSSTLNSNPIQGGYHSGWSALFAYFLSLLLYTTVYVTVVQKSFGLIAALPDKVLRWIGGQPENAGQEAAGWAGDVKGKMDEGSKAANEGMAQTEKSMGGNLSEQMDKAKQAGASAIKAMGS